jgi:hypothetical protein
MLRRLWARSFKGKKAFRPALEPLEPRIVVDYTTFNFTTAFTPPGRPPLPGFGTVELPAREYANVSETWLYGVAFSQNRRYRPWSSGTKTTRRAQTWAKQV